MADYDSDDLEDYDESMHEEFHEDDLDDEEYDQLYASLPTLVQSLKNYNDEIPEFDLKEALYFNHYDIDLSVKEIKSRFKKKGKYSFYLECWTHFFDFYWEHVSNLEPAQKPKLSKLAQLAKARSQNHESLNSAGQEPSSSEKVSSNVHRPSKLSALAKARAMARDSEKPERGPSKPANILDNFGKTANSGVDKKPQTSGLKPNRLLDLAAKRKKRAMEAQAEVVEVLAPTVSPPVPDPKEKHQTVEKQNSHSLALHVTVDRSLLRPPGSAVTLFLFQNEPPSKRMRPNNGFFQVFTNHEAPPQTISKAQKNFSEPSPDDKIINAQKQAFQGDFENLSLQEKPANAKTKVPTTKPFKKIDIKAALSKKLAKPHKSFVVIGHVDAGKSTLMGRLLFDLGVVDAKTVNKLVREAEKSGKGSFALAWVMDQTADERSRGVTVDICATNFETERNRFTAIDAPGHKDFVPQMISGVSQADLGLLVVDSIAGEFESGFIMDGQTKEHTILAKNFGVERLCVVINKMDKEDWSESRFDEIKRQLTEYLGEIGYELSKVDFIPISGLEGTNVVNKKNIPNWYKGKTLVEYLELVDVEAAGVDEVLLEDFNMTITDVFEITNSDFGLTGKVISGVVQNGETIRVAPSDDCVQIQSMKLDDTAVDIASQGDFVLLRFKTNQLANGKIEDLAVGDLALRVESSVKSATSLTATIHLFNLKKPLLVGTPFVLFRNNCQVPARISKVIEIEGTKKKRMHLVSNQTALVEITITDRKLPVSKYIDNKVLGRVVIRREGVTIGAGVVEDVL